MFLLQHEDDTMEDFLLLNPNAVRSKIRLAAAWVGVSLFHPFSKTQKNFPDGS